MTIQENGELIRDIGRFLAGRTLFSAGTNKNNELVRLIYESCRKYDVTYEAVLDNIGFEDMLEDGKGGLFRRLKDSLMGYRFENTYPERIMPFKIQDEDRECLPWDNTLSPKRIFVEESVSELPWTRDFLGKFTAAKVLYIKDVRDVRGKGGDDNVQRYDRRRETIYIVKNKAAFVKKCPCTKGCRGCGYWVLNIGFGCPMDCSYCYLQQYSNVDGIILPANIEDYTPHIMGLDRDVSPGTRIGTGEFTDSLALDGYTGYSRSLMDIFRKTNNLVLELKTKSASINNILENNEPHEHVVMSWSVNARMITERYEKGCSSMDDRIRCMVEAAGKGFRIGLHFDPIIYYKGWETGYSDVIREICSRQEVLDRLAWVSLGTLRYAPGLKQIAERRFCDNLIYYAGDIAEDKDGKLRYSNELRENIYRTMADLLRKGGVKSWIYLCMEFEEVCKSFRLNDFPNTVNT
ncbi:MAG: hypothetical protein PHH49_01180 [Candidatus Omnitrophica bacterium]|nr:hypothetical protein [Candidatus Omnitrophota bacterium]MDD5487563.1 hypothetical protein [Candidatus Omnitrophota bacterium]